MRGSAGADRIFPKLIVGIKMEKQNLNNSMCEELFGGKLDVVEVPDDCKKPQARQH